MSLENAFIAMMRSVVREELASFGDSRPETDGEFISVQVAARRANVSEKTVRRWIKSGLLKPGVVGRVYRIRADDLAALLTRADPTGDDRLIIERLVSGSGRRTARR